MSPPSTEKSSDPTGTVTLLLNEARSGRPEALNDLFHHIEGDLRRLAQSMINSAGRPGGGLHGTELVNMACLRLLGQGRLDAENRRHFFFLFGRAMNDVLLEESRRAGAQKRGGDQRQVPLVDFAVDGITTSVDVLDLRAAIEALRAVDPEAAQVVEIRILAGRSIDEAAEVLEWPVSKTRRNWDYAKAWLSARLAANKV